MEPIRMQKVIDWLEENLTEKISFADAAAMMAVSEADLQRSFKMVTGITMSEYLRCRRLSRAAEDLKNGCKVLDTALVYGYQTAESFSKAFKLFHGCTPAEAKNPGCSVRCFNPIVIKLAKRGGNTVQRSGDETADLSSVMAYYESSDEHSRLTRSKHARIEYLVTMEYLQKVLPENCSILDCCAGTGVYAFALAERRRVTAGDLSAKNIRIMEELQRERPLLEGIRQLNACDMSIFPDESFDAVLCMGALYHLADHNEQLQAIRECARVCRKGGVLVFAYLNKWGSFFNGMINNLKSMELLCREFDSGNHEDVFFRTTPDVIDADCRSLQLERLYNVGVDHLAYLSAEQVDRMSGEEYATLLEYQLKASAQPDIAGTSLHGLWIGRK